MQVYKLYALASASESMLVTLSVIQKIELIELGATKR